MTLKCSDTTVEKRGTTLSERECLAAEARVLHLAAHPGVVRLLGIVGGEPPEALLLGALPRGDLSELGTATADVVAGLGAALATTVADLHDLGVAHGAIDASHVLLDDDGRPILCGFGTATLLGDHPDANALRSADVIALATLLLGWLPPGAPRSLTRLLGRARHSPRGRQPPARRLAQGLVEAVPEARLPSLSEGGTGPGTTAHPPPPNPQSRRWTTGRVLATAGTAAVTLAAATALIASAQNRGAPAADQGHPSLATPTACPAVDAGCHPLPSPDGVITTAQGSFSMGVPGEVVVVGRWQCGPMSLPAVLERATGQVWVFDRWASRSQPVTGRLIAQVVGAQSLAVTPAGKCDHLRVQRGGLPPVTLDPGLR